MARKSSLTKEQKDHIRAVLAYSRYSKTGRDLYESLKPPDGPGLRRADGSQTYQRQVVTYLHRNPQLFARTGSRWRLKEVFGFRMPKEPGKILSAHYSATRYD